MGLAVAAEVLGAVRAGAVFVFSNSEAGRVSAGFTSRFGCSTFFSGFGLGFGFGFGFGLWITTGASFGGSGITSGSGSGSVPQRAQRPAEPPEAVPDLPGATIVISMGCEGAGRSIT